ncbi:MAG: multidrug efflux SMR transporter [Candidatus Thiodiazotropha sp. (ex Monitilora ramsayi)]|nr:multidrug efflux SMR transporter [Candidatus Thiodiazotropha sp. (ex Monitilora ramsayi)]
MAWIWLISAGFSEVLFATFLKLSDGFSKPIYSIAFVVAAAFSFFCLTKAMQNIPIGTAYAVWTGIGAAGVVILGIILFSEPLTAGRLFFISTLVASIIGLKLVS